MNDKEKQIVDTLVSFFGQFETFDVYTEIVLEEFFKELLDEQQNLHISCTERQAGNKDT